jgi:hypothetical protein
MQTRAQYQRAILDWRPLGDFHAGPYPFFKQGDFCWERSLRQRSVQNDAKQFDWMELKKVSFKKTSESAAYVAAKPRIDEYIRTFDLRQTPDDRLKAFLRIDDPNWRDYHPFACGAGLPVELHPNAYLHVRKDHPNTVTAPFFSVFRRMTGYPKTTVEIYREEVAAIRACEVAALHPQTHLLYNLSDLRRALSGDNYLFFNLVLQFFVTTLSGGDFTTQQELEQLDLHTQAYFIRALALTVRHFVDPEPDLPLTIEYCQTHINIAVYDRLKAGHPYKPFGAYHPGHPVYDPNIPAPSIPYPERWALDHPDIPIPQQPSADQNVAAEMPSWRSNPLIDRDTGARWHARWDETAGDPRSFPTKQTQTDLRRSRGMAIYESLRDPLTETDVGRTGVLLSCNDVGHIISEYKGNRQKLSKAFPGSFTADGDPEPHRLQAGLPYVMQDPEDSNWYCAIYLGIYPLCGINELLDRSGEGAPAAFDFCASFGAKAVQPPWHYLKPANAGAYKAIKDQNTEAEKQGKPPVTPLLAPDRRFPVKWGDLAYPRVVDRTFLCNQAVSFWQTHERVPPPVKELVSKPEVQAIMRLPTRVRTLWEGNWAPAKDKAPARTVPTNPAITNPLQALCLPPDVEMPTEWHHPDDRLKVLLACEMAHIMETANRRSEADAWMKSKDMDKTDPEGLEVSRKPAANVQLSATVYGCMDPAIVKEFGAASEGSSTLARSRARKQAEGEAGKDQPKPELGTSLLGAKAATTKPHTSTAPTNTDGSPHNSLFVEQDNKMGFHFPEFTPTPPPPAHEPMPSPTPLPTDNPSLIEGLNCMARTGLFNIPAHGGMAILLNAAIQKLHAMKAEQPAKSKVARDCEELEQMLLKGFKSASDSMQVNAVITTNNLKTSAKLGIHSGQLVSNPLLPDVTAPSVGNITDLPSAVGNFQHYYATATKAKPGLDGDKLQSLQELVGGETEHSQQLQLDEPQTALYQAFAAQVDAAVFDALPGAQPYEREGKPTRTLAHLVGLSEPSDAQRIQSRNVSDLSEYKADFAEAPVKPKPAPITEATPTPEPETSENDEPDLPTAEPNKKRGAAKAAAKTPKSNMTTRAHAHSGDNVAPSSAKKGTPSKPAKPGKDATPTKAGKDATPTSTGGKKRKREDKKPDPGSDDIVW